MLDRVLGRQHPESIRQRDGFVSDGDLPLLHGLEQGALNLGRCSIDLVGEEDAGHDRAGTNVEGTGRGPVNLGASEVRRKEIGSELDSPEREVQSLGQGTNGAGLGQPGNAFDQNVAAG